MFTRWYSALVLVFWLATTSWLVKEKILPPLLVGEPPSYRTILEAESHAPAPVGWEILLNNRLLGWAASRTERQEDGVCEVRTRVRLDELPLAELTPAWIASFVKLLGATGDAAEANISLEAKGTLEIDSLGHPIGFRSRTRIGPALGERGVRSILSGMNLNISMNGKVEGDQMHVMVQSGDFEYRTKIYLPADALMGDILAPPTSLPHLRVGQSWTVPIYSPFRPPNAPMEMLHASVDRKDIIVWRDRVIPTYVVGFRGDPGLGLTSNQAYRAVAWVDGDGRVVKQEIPLLASRLTFIRMADDQPWSGDLQPEHLDQPLPRNAAAPREEPGGSGPPGS